MRQLMRPFWVLIALAFLLEAWLWDHLEPIAARIVALVPLRQLKRKLAEWIEHLHPVATLVVFALPGVLLFPFKLLGLYLLAQGYWFSAIALFTLAKLVGLASPRSCSTSPVPSSWRSNGSASSTSTSSRGASGRRTRCARSSAA